MSKPRKKKAKPQKAAKKSSPKKSKPKVTKKVEKEVEKEVKVVEVEAKKVVAKAKKVVEKVEGKASPKKERVKYGPAPWSTVTSRHIDATQEKQGRGFSFGELRSAGIPINTARQEGLSVDIRRRSVNEGNVEALKTWFKAAAS